MEFGLNSSWSQFISNPSSLLNNVFDKNASNAEAFSNPIMFHFALKEELRKCLEADVTRLLTIPSLNACENVESIPNRSIVRFRCMIQDMFDPEIAVVSAKQIGESGNECFKYSLYSDTLDDCNSIDISENNKMIDRFKFYCTKIPGENDWVQLSDCENEMQCSVNDSKRRLESPNDSMKKLKTENDISPEEPTSNVEPNKADHSQDSVEMPYAVVKCYESLSQSVKLNDKIEVIGVFDLNGEINAEDVETASDQLLTQLTLGEGSNAKPRKSMPIIHAITVNRLNHNNPLLTNEIWENLSKSKQFFIKTKKELKALLSKALFGDDLAAEYLILALISKVCNRRDVIAIGSLPINFCNLTSLQTNPDYLKRLFSLLSSFTTNSHYLNLTLQNLNNNQLIPKKDYEENKLSSTILQISSDTLLFVDETKMTPGQLSNAGLNNFSAVKDIVHKQQINYDFGFQRIPFDTDANVVVFSERSSLLSIDCKVSLQFAEAMANVFDVINDYLSDSLLRDIRIYLTLCKHVEYELSKEMQTFVEHDLVSIMNEASQSSAKLSIDDLHLLMTLSRLFATSEGESSCSVASWKNVKQLEQSRRSRL
ncbi:mini-chromosome maintenance complex-binding protein-like isoform X1 [Leptotrombidium deliense]|uniref:Mini-chromosome maintenance complex-binding protein n=1 Tax=Leptotrombidium deliense TaxID=299467 RepID=A0A443SHK8_9ACAR|nr:mini-chromosome maintenance complex-binding protein-like isoform X1 [Leptotrombidium deliense]